MAYVKGFPMLKTVMNRILNRVLPATLGLTALTLAACSPSPSSEANKGEINIYTARHYDADSRVYEAFTAKTGIKVNFIEMRPAEMIERLKAEGAASPADLILMADAGALWRAQQADLFQPVTSPALTAAVPAALRQADGLWYGFSRRARVIIYDKAKVKPEEVATYDALAAPRFKGKVCVRSSDNVYNLSLMAALIEHWGEEKALNWARGVVGNMARDPQGGDMDQIKAIGVGVCEVALSNTYYYLRLTQPGPELDAPLRDKTAMAFPSIDQTGTHVNISGGGVAKHAAHKAEAVQFLEFMASPEAQTLFAQYNHEFPIIASDKTPAHIAEAETFTTDPIPVETYGKNQAAAQKLFDAAKWK